MEGALLHVLGHIRDSGAMHRVYRVPYTWAYKSRAWQGACYMYFCIQETGHRGYLETCTWIWYLRDLRAGHSGCFATSILVYLGIYYLRDVLGSWHIRKKAFLYLEE